jgi:hypothetical protein
MTRPRTRQELEDLLRKQTDLSKKTTIRVVGPEADGVAFFKQDAEFIDQGGNAESISFYESMSCPSSGDVLGTDNQLAGRCSVCKTFVCSQCMQRCDEPGCQIVLCRQHVHKGKCFSHFMRVFRRNKQAVFAVLYKLRHSVHLCRYNSFPEPHGF